MNQTIPNGYYSLAEVFDILGQDTFQHAWTGKEIECQNLDLRKKLSPISSEVLDKNLEALNNQLGFSRNYKSYILFNNECWSVFYQIKEQAENYYRIYNKLEKYSEENVEFLQFLESTMRYFVIKKRLLSLLDWGPIKAFIQDIKTGKLREIPEHQWLIHLNPFSKSDLTYDILNSTGSYGFKIMHMFEVYKGPLIIFQQAFQNYRAGRHPNQEEETNEKTKAKRNKLNLKGSAYMQAIFQCYDDLKVDTENQPCRRDVEKWIGKHAKFITSQREMDYFFTFLRDPEMKKGGKWNKDKIKRKPKE